MLANIRLSMERRALRALIVPSSDPHNSEYVANDFKLRGKISNFHGSAGTCVITPTEALLWTDGRYWLEAQNSMLPEWTLMKDGAVGVPTYESWLEDKVGGTAESVGLDPFLTPMIAWERLGKKVTLVSAANFLEPILSSSSSSNFGDAKEEEVKRMIVRPEQFCGESTSEKVKRVSQEAKKKKCDFLFLSALDDIAWLTNLRGFDVPYNPVFYAYGVVDVAAEKVVVFVDPRKLPIDPVSSCITFLPYNGLAEWVASQRKDLTIGVDENQTSYGAFLLLSGHFVTVRRISGIVQAFKAVKNAAEIQGFRDCHIRDGCALTRFLAWLDREITTNNSTIDEVDAADRLEALRREEANFVQLSFGTISGTGPNGAVIHYSPTKPSCTTISPKQLYLVDSGAQYLDGTTDVTRTVCFSPPNDMERETYTLVLQGHIAINSAIWPKGTTGHRIDAFARSALWRRGLNYMHGTGHGVGSFLNVHEGPHGIHTRPTATGATLDLHMICSNEPGYYMDGAFGIRIENLEVVVPAVTKYGGDGYLTFDYLTMAPLCRDLIDVSLLRPEEIEWVNKYHETVRHALLPLLEARGDTLAVSYLEKHTSPLPLSA